MKKGILTVTFIAGFVALLFAINRIEPERLTEERQQEAERAKEQLEMADALEEQAKAAAESKEQEQPEEAAPAETPENAFRIKFETTKGDFVVECYPDWAPLGAARFKEAVEAGVYNDCAIFRVIPDFVIQFGIPGDPEMSAKWADKNIMDDPVKQSNARGLVTYAKTQMPNSRSTQVFVNLRDNSQLDGMGFAPFGKVIEGMDVVTSMNSQYGETLTNLQPRIQAQGNAFLRENFPNLDYIKKATVAE